MATMPSTDYHYPAFAEVPDFDLPIFNQNLGTYDLTPGPLEQWSQFADGGLHHQRRGFFKQEPGHVPIPKVEPIPDFDSYLDSNWQWPNPVHHLPMNGVMASSYQQTGSPTNPQLQLSDPPTPAAECQVTSTNLSPIPSSPYSPHSDVGSYDGALHGESFLTGESHFDTTELNEINIKGLTEEQLVSLTARDLNRICREMPEDIVKQLKKRRRTLKNRGYAYNSRVRRVTQKTALETERDELKQQIQQLTERCRYLEKEAEQWKKKVQTFEGL